MNPYSVSLRRCSEAAGMPEKMRLGSGHHRTDRCVVAGAVAAIIHAAFLWPSLFSEEAENGTAENGGERRRPPSFDHRRKCSDGRSNFGPKISCLGRLSDGQLPSLAVSLGF